MRENQIKKLGNYHFVGKTLGKGHFGFVELALHTLTDIKVAVKITEIHGEKAATLRRNCYREVSTLNKLNHPCIVKIHETFRTKNTCCLVMEYVDGGDLLTFVREKAEGKLVEEDARWYFEQLVSVVDYLHQRRIVHRDLKMENILLQGANKRMVKVIDFGLSNAFSKGEFLSTKCGSPEYAAPELFQRDCKYGTEVDVWSLGIILYGMLVGQLPFRNGNYGKLVCLISKGLTSVHQANMKNLNPECVVLLSNILQPESSRRYTVRNIIAHPWTCAGRNKLAILGSPTVDRTIKLKLIKAVADIMELSRTEVSLAVESGQCDSIFGVYSILLQEELKQNNGAPRTMSAVVIRDHSNTTRLAGGKAEKRRKMNENDGITSRNIPQRNRLRNSQAKRWAMKKKAQDSERKIFDGVSCVVGTSIGRPATERNSTDRNEIEKEKMESSALKEAIESKENKSDYFPESTCENIVEKTSIHDDINETETMKQIGIEKFTAGSKTEGKVEESLQDVQRKDKEDDLKKKSENEDSILDVMLNGNKTFSSQEKSVYPTSSCSLCNFERDASLTAEPSCIECFQRPGVTQNFDSSSSNTSSVTDSEDIRGDESTTVDKTTESHIATPSLAASSVSDILSWMEDEQCFNGQVWMDVDNKELVSEYDEVESGIRNDRSTSNIFPTCVTLQVIYTKKQSPIQQKFIRRRAFKAAERKDLAFSTIPTKEIVNPSKVLEEAIEERLKPCLKNSAASLRERPRTAGSQISRKSIQSESNVCVSKELPPRPKTVATSKPRSCSVQSRSSKTGKRTTEKCINGALRYWRPTRKSGPRPKVDFWLANNDTTFKISGKKIHVEGSSNCGDDEKSRKISETQHATVLVPNRISTDPSTSNVSTKSSENTSSINLVVGKGCFKKETAAKNVKHENEVSTIKDAEELPESNSDICDFVTAWLSKLELDSKSTEKPETCSVASCQNSVTNFGNSRNPSRSSRNPSTSSRNRTEIRKSYFTRENMVYEDSELEVKNGPHVRISASDVHGKSSGRPSSSRMYKSSEESVVAKWNAVEKFICTGQKMNTWTREQMIQTMPPPEPQAQSECVQPESWEPVRVPSVAMSVKQPHLVVPNPSMDTMMGSGEEFDGERNLEHSLIKKYCHNGGGIVGLGGDLEKIPNSEQSSHMASKNRYWSQMTSSELEKEKLAMGSKEWMGAHLTAVLDKAKMTRELCQMG